jgi:hypothetical protein
VPRPEGGKGILANVGQTGILSYLPQETMKRDRKELIMISLLKKSQTLGFALLALTIFLPACTHRKFVQLDSHKITVSRHGFEKKFHVAQLKSGPRFEYAGVSADGRGLKVSIEGDKITINGVDGKLRPGDSVLISDDGVAVNSLDYGESEKYLQANNPAPNAAARN